MFDLLRGHVFGGAKDRCQLRQRVPPTDGRRSEPEVHDAQRAIATDHDVRRLEIPVDDASAVHITHGLANRTYNLERVVFSERPRFVSEIVEGASSQGFHHDIRAALLACEGIKTHDQWM